MVRASAKSYLHVWCVTSPEQYVDVIEALEADADTQRQLRTDLSYEAFAQVSDYDDAIDLELSKRSGECNQQLLRYGKILTSKRS